MKRSSYSLSRAFTLIELMTVIAIIGLLVAVSVPAMRSMLDNNNLTRAGQSIADQIGMARQVASARNRPVEIRFIKFAQLKTPSLHGYNAIQLWMTDSSGTFAPFNKLTPLPDNIAIAESSLSPALAIPTPSTIDSGPAANAQYVALQIRPSGIVTPTIEMDQLYLTVLASNNTTLTSLPGNYITIQINPTTGTPLIYRP